MSALTQHRHGKVHACSHVEVNLMCQPKSHLAFVEIIANEKLMCWCYDYTLFFISVYTACLLFYFLVVFSFNLDSSNQNTLVLLHIHIEKRIKEDCA